MTGATGYVGYLRLLVGGRIGMGGRTKLLICQKSLVERTGSGGMNILAEYGKRLPKGKGLKCQNYLHIRTTRHIGDDTEIATKQILAYNINRCFYLHNIYDF